MELKLDKTTKILLGAIALGLFLNASNVFIDKAYANQKKITKVQICGDTPRSNKLECAYVENGRLNISNLLND